MPLIKQAEAPVAETAGLLTRYKTPIMALGGIGALAAAGGFYQRHKQRKREEEVVNRMLGRGVPKYAEEVDLIVQRYMEKDAAFWSPIVAGAKALGAGVKAAFSGGPSNMNFFRKGMNSTIQSLRQQGYKNMARGARNLGNTMANATNKVRTFFSKAPGAAPAAGGAATG